MYRKLTEDERNIFYGAMANAINTVPAFRDAFALLNPFYDASCDTCYVDKWARMGVGPTFLEEWTATQRATALLHEALHVVNDHHARGDRIAASPHISNIAGDLEINSTISTLGSVVDLSQGIMPNRAPFSYPLYLSLEQYYHHLKEDVDNGKMQDPDSAPAPCDGSCGEDGEGAEGSPCDGSCEKGEGGSGQGTPMPGGCDEATDERASAADDLGVEKASHTEKNIAKNNTVARLQEEKKNKTNRQRGVGAGDNFIDLTLALLQPPKVPWQEIFRPLVARSCDSIANGRTDHSYRRVNRRRSGISDLIFPGMVTYNPKVMFAFDTSGSMTKDDYTALLLEVEGLLKGSVRNEGFSIFPIDTTVKDVQTVRSVKEVKITGGGGTDMSVGLRYVNELRREKQPDLMVLATDGFTSWTSYERELLVAQNLYRHVLLITTKEGFATVPESVHDLCLAVLDISSDH